MRIGRETQLLRLGQIAGNGIIFKVAEMGGHQCVIIPVVTDIKGVEVTEIHELPDRSLESAWFGRYHRISLQTIALSFQFGPVRRVTETEKEIEQFASSCDFSLL